MNKPKLTKKVMEGLVIIGSEIDAGDWDYWIELGSFEEVHAAIRWIYNMDDWFFNKSLE